MILPTLVALRAACWSADNTVSLDSLLTASWLGLVLAMGAFSGKINYAQLLTRKEL